MKASTTFVSRVHDEVEITSHQPRPHMKVSDILQLAKEGTLVHVPLGTINAREPPTLIHTNGDTCRERIIRVVGV
jgi:hypothetical protein